MANIIHDLVGVVFVRTPTGTVVLRAGDVIPEGASVGSHLVEGGEPVSGDTTDDAEDSSQGTDDAEEVNKNGKAGRTRRRSTANKP